MAITISGENNNDRILAQDGVIDSISGFNIAGIITASSFTGDLTGDVTGNLTGNVTGNINNTTLLLQTGGSERVRIASNGKVGVGVNPTNYPGIFVVSGDALICDRDIHSRVANSVDNSDRGFKQDIDGTEKLHLYADNSSNIILEGNGGLEKLRIASTGKVGIGTDSVDANLTVFTSTPGENVFNIHADLGTNNNRTFNLYAPATDSGAEPYIFQTGNSMLFKVDTTDSFKINSNSYIGIGTDNPTEKLDIISGTNSQTLRIWSKGLSNSSSLMLRSGDSGGTFIKFGDNSDNDIGQIHYSNSTNAMRFVVNTQERLRIASDGKIGFGDFASGTSLSYPLHLKNAMGSSPSFIHMEVTGSNTVGGGGGIAFDTSASNNQNNNTKYLATITGIRNSANDGSNDLVFSTSKNNVSGSGPVEKVRITSDGLTTLKNFNGTGLRLQGSGSDYQGMQLQVTDASASQTRNVFIDAVNETGAAVANQVGAILSDGGSEWRWSTQPPGNRTDRRVERLRITSSGQFNIAGNMQFTVGNPELEFNNGGPRFRVPAANTLAIHNGGTLGSTNNEVIRINSGGRVGIGTATIPSNVKLDVTDGIIRSQAGHTFDTRIEFFRKNTGSLAWIGIPSWSATSLYIYGPTATSNEIAAAYGGSTWNFYTGGSSTPRFQVESDGNVKVNGGELGISTNTNNTSVLSFRNSVKDHKIGGVTVSLTDDSISSDIMLPGHRHGCLLFVFGHSDDSGTYPQPGPCGMVYVDVGASTNIRPMYTQGGTGADATTNTGMHLIAKSSHETNINNCDDGKLTVMKGSANGRIKLANRLDGTYTFYLTMI